ncbi:uncharacterized protein LOC108832057 [Raphanus sativus]|uniref:RING-type E3 ubiquitin transferase n=1 Tax=Raphanus sativus TaxID=3726 RepID=A0A9W3DEP0_RAPSA|nr:uncharacterized protein LOC108832057 [Raphanus sativus]
MDVAAIEPAMIVGTVGSNLALEKIPSGDLCSFSIPILEWFTDFVSSGLDELQGASLVKVANTLWMLGLGCYFISGCRKYSYSSYMEKAISVSELKKLNNLKIFVDVFGKYNKPLVVKFTGVVCCEAPTVVSLPNLDSDVESKAPFVTTLVTSRPDDFISCVIYNGETEITYADRAINGDRFSSTMGLKSIHDEVPWYLAGDTERVYVEGIQMAKGFDLVTHKREVAGPGTAFLRALEFAREIDSHQGMKIIGVKHTECALKVDSALTVVGNATKDDRGNITIRDPLFVCPSDVDYNVAKSTVFGQPSAWDIGWMAAFALSAVLFATQSLKKFSFSETPSQVADGLDFLFKVDIP